MSKIERLRRAAQRLAAMLVALFRAIFGGLDAATAALDDALGAIRKPWTPSAEAIADEAVATDHEPHMRPSAIIPPPPALMGVQISMAARMMAEDPSSADYVSEDLPPYVSAWLARLSPSQLQRVGGLSPYAVEAHCDIGRQAQWDPQLPPVHAVYSAPVRRMDQAEMAAVLAQARRNMAGDRAEAEAMAQRGPRPRPGFDDGAADDFAPAGPRFH